MNDEMNNNMDENTNEEVVHEEEEFEDWNYSNGEDNIMNENNQNAQNQNVNNMNEQQNTVDISFMSDAELKELQKKINAEKAARTPKWKRVMKKVAIGLGIAGAAAGVGYGVKKIFDKKTDVDSCGNNGVDIESEAARWGVDVA